MREWGFACMGWRLYLASGALGFAGNGAIEPGLSGSASGSIGMSTTPAFFWACGGGAFEGRVCEGRL